MQIIGLILIITGAILYFSSRLIYKKNNKKSSLEKDINKEDENFLVLLSNGLIVFKIIAVLLIVAGCVFLMFL